MAMFSGGWRVNMIFARPNAWGWGLQSLPAALQNRFRRFCRATAPLPLLTFAGWSRLKQFL
jgi:hypothetical protein